MPAALTGSTLWIARLSRRRAVRQNSAECRGAQGRPRPRSSRRGGDQAVVVHVVGRKCVVEIAMTDHPDGDEEPGPGAGPGGPPSGPGESRNCRGVASLAPKAHPALPDRYRQIDRQGFLNLKSAVETRF